ncbi:MAG: hypothetical protein HUJ91_06255, partial [Bacteroidales bacterium]|nr:hypothetical protein [Bacteroidales bacterium]
GIYIYGSGSEGIVALDRDGKVLWRIDKNRNLQNETVLGLLCDKRGNVWASLDNGVSLIMTNSEISCFESKFEHIGMVYDILQEGSATFIATNKGLFTYGRDKVVPVEEVSGQTWYLEKFDNDLFVGNNAATYRKSGASFAADAKRSGAICLTQAYWSDNVPYLFEGTYTNIRVYRKDHTGRWQPYSEIPGTPLAKNIEVDASFHIWYEHLSKGITRITLSEDMREVVEEKTFAELDGPQHGRLALFKINGRICISDGESFFTYDDITDSITPYKALNDIAGHISGVHQAIRGEKTTYWLTGNEEIVQIDCSSNKYRIIREIPFILFGSKSDDRASLSAGNDPEFIYLCLDDKLIRIGQAKDNDSQVGFSLFQAQMTNGRGETYSVGLPDKIKTRRGFNNVTFLLRCTQYDRLNLKILYRVKGLDDNWSLLSPYNMKLSFARLAARHYRFQARLLTHDDVEVGTIDVPIQVLSKWSRSRIMILLYLMLLVSASLFVGRNAKKLIQWVKFLQDSVLSAMSAKEEMADQLKAREKDLAGIMVGGISTDNEKWEIFRQNFNRVDEHFFSNLSEKYPSLTTSDLKFCALLRLNMNTKEIATALNLTTRGVESARYRLRKKFNLGQNESLTAFIHNIK